MRHITSIRSGGSPASTASAAEFIERFRDGADRVADEIGQDARHVVLAQHFGTGKLISGPVMSRLQEDTRGSLRDVCEINHAEGR